MSGMPCMSCRAAVEPDKAKVFAEVFVCPACYEKAERIFTRCDGELRRLLLLLRESIRVALLEGKLQYGPSTPLDEVPKAELLKVIMQLSEKNNGQPPTRPSGG